MAISLPLSTIFLLEKLRNEGLDIIGTFIIDHRATKDW